MHISKAVEKVNSDTREPNLNAKERLGPTSQAVVLIRRVSMLWAGSLAAAGLTFLAQVVVSRTLDIKQFGHFSAALSLASIMAPIACYGFSQAILVFYGRGDSRLDEWRQMASRLSFIFGAVCAIFVFCYGTLQHPHPQYLALYLAFALYPLGQAMFELNGSVYQVQGRYRALAIWQALPHMVRFSLIVVLVWFGLMNKAWHAAICYTAVAVLMGAHVYWTNPHKGVRAMSVQARELTAVSTPYGLASLFNLIYMQSAVVLIASLVSVQAAGPYSLALSIVAATYLLPTTLFQKYLLPKVHRAAREGASELQRIYRLGTIAMLISGFLVAAGVWLLADTLVAGLFGPRYGETTAILRVLAISIPFMYLAFSSGCILATEHQIIKKVAVMGAVAVLSLCLNFSLLPAFGAIAGAYVAVLCNIVLAGAYFLLCRNYISRS